MVIVADDRRLTGCWRGSHDGPARPGRFGGTGACASAVDDSPVAGRARRVVDRPVSRWARARVIFPPQLSYEVSSTWAT